MKTKIGILIIVITMISFSCKKSEDGRISFTLKTQYDTIRSCPGGGGIFIISLPENLNLSGQLTISFEASSDLDVSISKTHLSNEVSTTEIVIEPKATIETKDYKIKVMASNQQFYGSIELVVSIFDWSTEVGEDLLLMKNEFDTWLNTNFPEYNIHEGMNWFAYPTYPQILIVEHYTFIDQEYEYRICRHAMIPPYDWSMIRLRKRNEVAPFLAARKDSTGGIIHQIPVEDYPTLFGY